MPNRCYGLYKQKFHLWTRARHDQTDDGGRILSALNLELLGCIKSGVQSIRSGLNKKTKGTFPTDGEGNNDSKRLHVRKLESGQMFLIDNGWIFRYSQLIRRYEKNLQVFNYPNNFVIAAVTLWYTRSRYSRALRVGCRPTNPSSCWFCDKHIRTKGSIRRYANLPYICHISYSTIYIYMYIYRYSALINMPYICQGGISSNASLTNTTSFNAKKL